jgi:hypothetical protein
MPLFTNMFRRTLPNIQLLELAQRAREDYAFKPLLHQFDRILRRSQVQLQNVTLSTHHSRLPRPIRTPSHHSLPLRLMIPKAQPSRHGALLILTTLSKL